SNPALSTSWIARYARNDGYTPSLLPARRDFAHLDGCELGRRTGRSGFERLLARAVEQEKPADDLLRLRERPVDHAALAIPYLHARALRRPAERIGRPQDALRLQAFAEAHHAVVDLMTFGERARIALSHRLHHQQQV